MKDKERVHSELCMLYSKRDVLSHEWARGELTSQSQLDDIWGKIYALRWVLDKNIQWGVADEPLEKGEPGTFELYPLRCYCYPGCELPAATNTSAVVPTSLAALEPVADTIICGERAGQQQLYYKAEDVQALIAQLYQGGELQGSAIRAMLQHENEALRSKLAAAIDEVRSLLKGREQSNG